MIAGNFCAECLLVNDAEAFRGKAMLPSRDYDESEVDSARVYGRSVTRRGLSVSAECAYGDVVGLTAHLILSLIIFRGFLWNLAIDERHCKGRWPAIR